MSDPDCEKCEELLQGYLDRDLTPAEVDDRGRAPRAAASTAAGAIASRRSCAATSASSASERMPAGLMAKLTELRGPTADGL